jgi:hypothetical protein
MVRLICCMLCWLPLQAALSVTKIGVTNNSAAFRISGATAGNCTLELSENSSYTPLQPDVDGAKYSGANTCAGRPDTKSSGSDLLVWLGHRVGDRALYADTTYYLRVTSGPDTASLTFATDTIGIGQTYPWPVPVDRRKWANRGFGITPSNLAAKSPQVDPVTGAKMWPMGGMGNITTREGPFSFVHWSDGTGWTNPGRITDPSTGGARTGNMNPLTVYIGTESDPHNWIYSTTGWNDLGILVYACADDASAGNRAFNINLFNSTTHSAIGTVAIPGSAVTKCASGPSGALPQVLSTSTDTNKPWPSQFPTAPFAGWGNDVMIGWDDRPMTRAGTVSGTLFTANGNDFRSHITPNLEIGDKVALPGCTLGSGLCTVSVLNGVAGLTVSGTPTGGAANATVLRSAIQIQKGTSTGNLWVSVKYKVAEAVLLNTTGGSLQTVCNTNSGPITTGDGHVGYLCMVTGPSTGVAFLYFLSADGTSRLVWHGAKPADTRVGGWPYSEYFTVTLGWPVADMPCGAGRCNGSLFSIGQMQPDPADPRGWYLFLNNAVPYEVYRLHYRGTVPVIDTGYGYDFAGGNSAQYPLTPPDDYFDWHRITPAAGTGSLGTQLAKFPYYPLSVWGTGFQFYGVSGTALYFENILGGQDHAGWVAVGDVSTGSMVLKNVFSSFDGSGLKGQKTRKASIHNVNPRPYPADTVVVAYNSLPMNDTPDLTRPYEGEWQMRIVAVDRGAVGNPSWSTNTALPWPIDNTYLNTCPTNSWGFTGNKCVHVKVSKGGFCNVNPLTSVETTPCPTSPAISGWNASAYRQSVPTREGAIFVDRFPVHGCSNAPNPTFSDCENFRIITPLLDESDGYTSFWIGRDAGYDYCTITGFNPADSQDNARHNTGWIARASPNEGRGCNGSVVVVQGQTEATSTTFEVPHDLMGHTDLVKGSRPGYIGYVSASEGNEANNLTDLFDLSKVKHYGTPTWHGSYTAIGGGVQAYTHTPGGTSWFTDSNMINGNVGGPGEVINLMGPTSIITATSCPDVYKITSVGTVDYKGGPLRGVAGSRPLQEVSSPAVDLCSDTVPGFTMAYAYRNGEAMSGTISGAGTSRAGDIFVKVPNAQPGNFGTNTCIVTQHWANTPCVISGNWTGGGFHRQHDYLQSDSNSTGGRWLTSGLEVPLAAYPYSGLIPLDDKVAWVPWAMSVNWGVSPWIIKMPRFIDDRASGVVRSEFIPTPVTVSAAAGSTKARVRFGRNKDFYCVGSEAIAADGSLDWSGRKEACVTDAGSDPFRFASETQTLLPCASGCTIKVPLVAQTINYVQVEHLDNSGAIIQTDPVQIMIVGNVIGPHPASSVSGSVSIVGGGKIQ